MPARWSVVSQTECSRFSEGQGTCVIGRSSVCTETHVHFGLERALRRCSVSKSLGLFLRSEKSMLIESERRGHVAVIYLNDDKRKNVLSTALVDEAIAAISDSGKGPN